jgi:uncharacterized Zn-binding protein involved in type VI secretion
MGQPAARLTSMTAHGGTVIAVNPTVLVGKMPVACLGDMHVCPMVNGVVPHVGGPILLGSFGVLAGGRPVARMGDMAVCVGPPDTIVLGEFTVLVGDISPSGGGGGGGGGSGEGGGGGFAGLAGAAMSAVGAAAALVMSIASSAAASSVGSQAAAQGGNSSTASLASKAAHWIKFQFRDKAGLPVSAVPYVFKGVDGEEARSNLNAGGEIHKTGIDSGQCSVRLLSLSDAKWSADEAETDDELTMSAKADGLRDGAPAEFKIFYRDLRGPDIPAGTVKAEVDGDKVEARWKLPDDGAEPTADTDPSVGYSRPEYFFIVESEDCRAMSGMLRFRDWLELEFKDEEENVLANEEYRLVLANGEIRKGTTDSQGRARIENVPPGPVQVEVPRFPGDSQGNSTG